MSFRQTLGFLGAYAALVALSVWFNVAVLCTGDAKYDHGCGGLNVYIPLWEMFLAPMAIAAIALERWQRSVPPSTARLALYLLGIMVIYQIGWRLHRFPQLLALEAIVIAVAVALRRRAVRQAGERRVA